MGTTQLPLPNGAQLPKFLAHVCCGQMAAWIEMPLGMELGLGPDDFVLDGDPAPLTKRGWSPRTKFLAQVIVANGWMDQDGTWHGGRPQPRRLCVRWGPSPLPKKKHSALHIFRPTSLVAKRLDASRCHLAYGGRPQPSGLCVRWGPSPHPQKGGGAPNFQPMSIAAKWLHGSRCHLVRR